MPKLGVVLKTSSFDFSPYGYIAAAIERLELPDIISYLGRYEAEQLKPGSGYQNLFDLALENLDRAVEDGAADFEVDRVFEIINSIIDSPKVEKKYDNLESELSKMLDKLVDLNIKNSTSPNDLLKKSIEGLQGSIVKLSTTYSEKNEFLSLLTNRPTIVSDVDILRGIDGLGIEGKSYDSFLKAALLSSDRASEWSALSGRDDKDKTTADVTKTVLQKKDLARDGIDEKEMEILSNMSEKDRSEVLSDIIPKLLKHERGLEQLMNLKSNNIIDSSVFGEVDLFSLYKYNAEALAYGLSVDRTDINKLDASGYSLMHYACANGEVGLVSDLIKKGGDVNVLAASNGLSPLHMLSLSQNHKAANDILDVLKKDRGFLNAHDSKDHLPVMLAMKNGNLDLAKAILDISPSESKDILSTILYRAVKSDDYDLVASVTKEMVFRDITAASVVIDGKPHDILEMSMEGDGRAFKAVIESPAIVKEVKSDLLEKAVLSGKLTAVKGILDYKKRTPGSSLDISAKGKTAEGEDVNILNIAYRSKTALENDNISLTKQLSGNIDADTKNMISAKIKSNLKAIEKLYDSINILLEYNVGEPGQENEKLDMLDLNVAFKVEPKKDGKLGKKENFLLATYTELSIAKKLAAETNNSEVAKIYKSNVERLDKTLHNIINHPRVDLNIPDEYGRNLLMLASEYGDRNVVGMVVSRSRDSLNAGEWSNVLESKDSVGNTAAFYAAQSGQNDIFDLLLSEGAVIRTEKGSLIKNDRGTTPLMAACSVGNLEIAKSIGVTGGDVLDVDERGNTAMHYLSIGSGSAKSSDLLANLLSKGADINAQNSDGKTPMIEAVISGNVGLIKELINKGADVNIADKYGNTPLIYAALLNDKDVIQAVLESNVVDVNKMNKDGVSPYLIVAQRDGLENMSTKVEPDMKKGVTSSVKAGNSSDMEEITKRWKPNTYPELAKILISRGADPYRYEGKSIYDSLISCTCAISLAQFSAAATKIISNSSPVYVGLAANLVNLSTSVYASSVVYQNVSNVVKSGVISWLSDGTELDKRLDLNDVLMIGAVHDEGIGFVKSGNALENGVKKHTNFIKSDKDSNVGIYTVEDLKGRISAKSTDWCLKAHDGLTAKYIALQQRIENQPWYYTFMPWKGIGFRRAANEILKAHDVISSHPNGSFIKSKKGEDVDHTFEKEFGGKGGLIELIRSSKSSNEFIRSMISIKSLSMEESEKLMRVNSLVDRVLNKEVSVSPDTFYMFSKFAIQRDNIMRLGDAQKYKFLASGKKLDGFEIKVDDEFIKSLADNRKSASVMEKMTSKASYKSKASIISGLQWLTGVENPYKVRDDVAGIIGAGIGSASGGYVLDPGIQSSLILGAANVVSAASGILGVAAANAPALMAVGGLYLAVQYKDAVGEVLSGATSTVSSLVQDGVKWLFGSGDKDIKINDTRSASDLAIDTDGAFKAIKGMSSAVGGAKPINYVESIESKVSNIETPKLGAKKSRGASVYRHFESENYNGIMNNAEAKVDKSLIVSDVKNNADINQSAVVEEKIKKDIASEKEKENLENTKNSKAVASA